MSAPAYLSTQSNLAPDVTSLSINYPQAGDSQGGVPPDPAFSAYIALVAWTSLSGTLTLTTPSGWTLAVTIAVGINRNLSLLYKPYDASTGTVTFVLDGIGDKFEGAISLWNGVSISSPLTITITATNSGLSSSHSVGGITTAYNNSALIAGFMSPDTPATFNAPADFATAYTGVARAITGGAGLLLSYGSQAAAGATGAKTATSINADIQNLYSVNSVRILAALNPFQGPSAITLLYANGGESIVIGTTQTLNCSPATHPTIAQSSLQYEYSYRASDVAAWTALSLTTAGVTTKSWATTGLSAGAQYKIRVRAYDGTVYGPYDQSDGYFSLIAETAPSVPTGLTPQNTAKNRQATIRLSWIHSGGVGNPQTAYAGEWSYNADMSSATAFSGSTNEFHDITANTFNHGATVYWRVKTTGFTLQSAFASPVSFVAANPPTAPNITAPTAASPPTTSLPTITFTATDGEFDQRRMRVTQGGGEVYTSGWLPSTAKSFPSPYAFPTGIASTLFIGLRHSSFLIESTEDSETFTPSISVPATPALAVVDLPTDGCIQATITNSDTPSYNELWRYVTADGSTTAIMVGDNIAVNGTLRDFNIKSAVQYSYFARAVNANGFAQSTTQNETLTLEHFWLHAITKTSSTSNALGTVLKMINLAPDSYQRSQAGSFVSPRGSRTKPVAILSNHTRQSLAINGVIPTSDIAMLNALQAIYDTNLDVCARNQRGDLVFGKLKELGIVPQINRYEISLAIDESDFTEAL